MNDDNDRKEKTAEFKQKEKEILKILRDSPNAEAILNGYIDALNKWSILDGESGNRPTMTIEDYAEELTENYIRSPNMYGKMAADPGEYVLTSLIGLEGLTDSIGAMNNVYEKYQKKAEPYSPLLKIFEEAVPFDDWLKVNAGIWSSRRKYETVLFYHVVQHVKDHKYTAKTVPTFTGAVSDEEYTEIKERVILDGEPQIDGVAVEYKKEYDRLATKTDVPMPQSIQELPIMTAKQYKAMNDWFGRGTLDDESEMVQLTIDSPFFKRNSYIPTPSKKSKVHVETVIGTRGENGEVIKAETYNYRHKRLIEAIGSIETSQSEEALRNGCITMDQIQVLLSHNSNARLLSTADEKKRIAAEEHNRKVDAGEVDGEKIYINTKEEDIINDLRYLIMARECIQTKAISEGHDVELSVIKECPYIYGTIEHRRVKHKNRVYEKTVFVPDRDENGDIKLPPRYKMCLEEKNKKGECALLTFPPGRLDTSYDYLQSTGIITAGYIIERKGQKYYHLVESVIDWGYYSDLKTLLYEKLNTHEIYGNNDIYYSDLMKKLFRTTEVTTDNEGRIHIQPVTKKLTPGEHRKFTEATKDILSIYKAKHLIEEWTVIKERQKETGVHVVGIHLDQPTPTKKSKEELKVIWDNFVADLKSKNIILVVPKKKK